MAADEKKTAGIGKGTPGPGRPKGVPNKANGLLRDAILLAAEQAGGPEGLVGYLRLQAVENPGPFLSLLGKVLPTQTALTDPDGNSVSGKITVEIVTGEG